MKANIQNLLAEQDQNKLEKIKDLPLEFLIGPNLILKRINKLNGKGEPTSFMTLSPREGHVDYLCLQKIPRNYKINFIHENGGSSPFIRIYGPKEHLVDLYTRPINQDH